MEFITLWTPGVKKNNRMFIYIIRKCEYKCFSRLRIVKKKVRIFAFANANIRTITSVLGFGYLKFKGSRQQGVVRTKVKRIVYSAI